MCTYVNATCVRACRDTVSTRSLRAGISGGYKPPEMAAGTKLWASGRATSIPN